jgi:hypothetical protein
LRAYDFFAFAAVHETPAGIGPTGASTEEVMRKHRNLLPKIMLILRIRVKIIIVRR